MKKITVLFAACIAMAAIVSSCGSGDKEKKDGAEATAMVDTTHAYVCPMHCEGSGSMEPGKCSVCGMDLVKNPDYKGETVVITDSISAKTPDTTAAENTADDKPVK